MKKPEIMKSPVFLDKIFTELSIRLETRRLKYVNNLKPKTLRKISRTLDERKARLDINPEIKNLVDTEIIYGERHDLMLMKLLSYYIVSLQQEKYESTLIELISNLEFRSIELEKEPFQFLRYQGWCVAIANTSGSLLVANREFLYQAGRLIKSEEEARKRLEELILLAFKRLNSGYDRNINSPGKWVKSIFEDDVVMRKRLAMATGYLIRNKYEIGPVTSQSKLISVISDNNNYDILIYLLTFAQLKFISKDEQFYISMQSAVSELGKFLLGCGKYADNFIDKKNEIKSEKYLILLKSFIRASINMECIESVNIVLLEINIPDLDLIEIIGLKSFLFIRKSYTGKAFEYDQILGLTRQKLSEVRESSSERDLFISNQIDQTDFLYRRGDILEARENIPCVSNINLMGQAALSRYLMIAGHLLDQNDLYKALRLAKIRVLFFSAKKLHDLNHVAQILLYKKLVEDYQTLENANCSFNLFRHLTQKKKPRLTKGDSVLLFVIEQCRVAPALLAPLTPILSSEGMKCCNLQVNRLENRVISPWTESPQLNASLDAIVGVEPSEGEYFQRWTIDFEMRIIEANGINYYQGIYERVARVLKVFNVDWSLPVAKTFFRQALLKADRLITALDGVRQIAERDNLSIRIATLQSHFEPHSVIRAYCSSCSKNIQHITLSSSYENWKTNVSGKPLGSLTLLNNTLEPKPSLPAFGLKRDFERWLVKEYEPNKEHFQNISSQLTSIKRAGGTSDEAKIFLDQMLADHSLGRKVFCLLGKIPYDLGVPYQGGPAHSSMSDWLNHTVEVVSGSKNKLYVKPHPHELNYSISARPIESFVDMIFQPEASNITILPHRGINVQDLLGVVDVFLCWNGSSIAELGSQGAKILAADDWAVKNYPINVTLPKDRNHYEKILRGEIELEMLPEFENLCTAYTCYLTEAPFAIPYPFVHRSSTNTRFNQAIVEFEKLSLLNIENIEEHSDKILKTFGITSS